jgi:hypothetical protein
MRKLLNNICLGLILASAGSQAIASYGDHWLENHFKDQVQSLVAENQMAVLVSFGDLQDDTLLGVCSSAHSVLLNTRVAKLNYSKGALHQMIRGLSEHCARGKHPDRWV